MAHYVHIAYIIMLKLFFTLIINSIHYLYCNIVIYKHDSLIDVIILQIPI